MLQYSTIYNVYIFHSTRLYNIPMYQGDHSQYKWRYAVFDLQFSLVNSEFFRYPIHYEDVSYRCTGWLNHPSLSWVYWLSPKPWYDTLCSSYPVEVVGGGEKGNVIPAMQCGHIHVHGTWQTMVCYLTWLPLPRVSHLTMTSHAFCPQHLDTSINLG